VNLLYIHRNQPVFDTNKAIESDLHFISTVSQYCQDDLEKSQLIRALIDIYFRAISVKNLGNALNAMLRDNGPSRHEFETDNNYSFVYYCRLNETGISVVPCIVEENNRVLRGICRKYGIPSHHFLRVSISRHYLSSYKEDCHEFSLDSLSDHLRKVGGVLLGCIITEIKNMLVFCFVVCKKMLRQGVRIGARHYRFLGFGSSQLCERSVWMYHQSSHKSPSVKDIHAWVGTVSDIKSISKYCSALGLAFSKTREGITVEKLQVKACVSVFFHHSLPFKNMFLYVRTFSPSLKQLKMTFTK